MLRYSLHGQQLALNKEQGFLSYIADLYLCAWQSSIQSPLFFTYQCRCNVLKVVKKKKKEKGPCLVNVIYSVFISTPIYGGGI